MKIALLLFCLFTGSLFAQIETPPLFHALDSIHNQINKNVVTYPLNSSAGPSLRLIVQPSEDWSDVCFAPEEGYDFSKHGEIRFRLTNSGTQQASIAVNLESQRPEEPKNTLRRSIEFTLDAGHSEEAIFPLVQHTMPAHLTPEDFFGMRGKPFYHPHSLDLAHLTKIKFVFRKSEQTRAFTVGPMTLHEEPRSALPAPKEPFPFIDQFGQYRHKDWPGKTNSIAQLKTNADVEAADLKAFPRPSTWNRFGGQKDGPQHKATGFFRTAKVNGKWSLIDPDGKAFFSTGTNYTGHTTGTILDDRERWFESLPADNEENHEFYSFWKPNLPHYHYYNRKCRSFNFHRYNIARKYGENWEEIFLQRTLQRLPSWGLNTLACWSDPRLFKDQKVPYVGFIKPRGPAIAGSSGHWGPFLDVFHPAFAASLEIALKKEKKHGHTEDPWMIGYYVDNEISWGNTTELAIGTLKSPVDQPAKQAFLKDLKKKYQEISKLNQTWKTSHESWEALAQSTTPPEVEPAKADLEAFVSRLCNRHFRLVAKAIKKHAPNHLYLGCRLTQATKNPLAVKASSHHCDIVSFNIYARHLEERMSYFDLVEDKPIIIGEFHFGALDRGPLHTGLVAVANQEERAQAYHDYVADCIAHPAIVGCHWFQYIDSPTSGRQWDGENYQIGFVDTADTPYQELIEASRKVAEKLYQP